VVLGQKTSAGFYKYDKRTTLPDGQAIAPFIEKTRQDAGNPQPINLSNEEIAQFILYAVANEALRVVAEGMVVRPSDIDIGSVYGYGFPAWRGGILKWAEMEGYKTVYVKLKYWSRKYNLPLLKPCSYLEQLAK
jgi:enoyl-CoA hydratase/3-hydroxyacyl-CoA dehydrogenase